MTQANTPCCVKGNSPLFECVQPSSPGQNRTILFWPLAAPSRRRLSAISRPAAIPSRLSVTVPIYAWQRCYACVAICSATSIPICKRPRCRPPDTGTHPPDTSPTSDPGRPASSRGWSRHEVRGTRFYRLAPMAQNHWSDARKRLPAPIIRKGRMGQKEFVPLAPSGSYSPCGNSISSALLSSTNLNTTNGYFWLVFRVCE